MRDLDTGTTLRVSVADDESVGNGPVRQFAMNDDGTIFAFESAASNLVQGDHNGIYDVFVRNVTAGTTTRASVSSQGAGQQSVPASDCRSQCGGVSLSGDGRLVVFDSPSPNLATRLDGNVTTTMDLNNASDVFIHDLESRITERVSVSDDGAEGNDGSWKPGFQAVSDDGRWVVFQSVASNLIEGDDNACPMEPGFPIGKSCLDVFARDRWDARTILVSAATDGGPANNASTIPVVSGNGRFVAFMSYATDLGPPDANTFLDVYVRDLQTSDMERVSRPAFGPETDGDSFFPHLSRDGRYVAFLSTARNLVEPGTHGVQHVYVYDRVGQRMHLASANDAGDVGNALSSYALLSSGGEYVAFNSQAANLVSNDTNQRRDTFLVDLLARGFHDAAGPEQPAPSPATVNGPAYAFGAVSLLAAAAWIGARRRHG